MNVSQQPFTPTPHATISFTAVGTTSTPAQLQVFEDANSCVRIFNGASATIFVEFDGSSPTASVANSMPIPAGGVAIVGNPQQFVAVVALAVTTGTIYFTPGNGIS